MTAGANLGQICAATDAAGLLTASRNGTGDPPPSGTDPAPSFSFLLSTLDQRNAPAGPAPAGTAGNFERMPAGEPGNESQLLAGQAKGLEEFLSASAPLESQVAGDTPRDLKSHDATRVSPPRPPIAAGASGEGGGGAPSSAGVSARPPALAKTSALAGGEQGPARSWQISASAAPLGASDHLSRQPEQLAAKAIPVKGRPEGPSLSRPEPDAPRAASDAAHPATLSTGLLATILGTAPASQTDLAPAPRSDKSDDVPGNLPAALAALGIAAQLQSLLSLVSQQTAAAQVTRLPREGGPPTGNAAVDLAEGSASAGSAAQPLLVLHRETHFAPVIDASMMGPPARSATAEAPLRLSQPASPPRALGGAGSQSAGPASVTTISAPGDTARAVPAEPSSQAQAGTAAGQTHMEKQGSYSSARTAAAPSRAVDLVAADAGAGPRGLSPGHQLAAAISTAASDAAESATASVPPISIPASAPSLPLVRILHVALQPENLGTVTVKLRVAGNQLELSVEAGRADTADVIEKDRDALSAALGALGYSVDALTIKVAPMAQAPSAGQTYQPGIADGQASFSWQGEGSGAPSSGRDEWSGQPAASETKDDRIGPLGVGRDLYV